MNRWRRKRWQRRFPPGRKAFEMANREMEGTRKTRAWETRRSMRERERKMAAGEDGGRRMQPERWSLITSAAESQRKENVPPG